MAMSFHVHEEQDLKLKLHSDLFTCSLAAVEQGSVMA